MTTKRGWGIGQQVQGIMKHDPVLWADAKAKAKADGHKFTWVVRALLRNYVNGNITVTMEEVVTQKETRDDGAESG
jgi:hypothetical protein